LDDTTQDAREIGKKALEGTLGADTTKGAIYFHTTVTPTTLLTDLAAVGLIVKTVDLGGNTYYKAKVGLTKAQIKDGYEANDGDSLDW